MHYWGGVDWVRVSVRIKDILMKRLGHSKVRDILMKKEFSSTYP